MKLLKEKVIPLIMNALSEDLGTGDITTTALFEKDVSVRAEVLTNSDCVLAGMDVARWVFDSLDEKIVFNPLFKDGDNVKSGKKVIHLKGGVRGILAGERSALNFLGRMSGIATLTAGFADRIKGRRAKILDTRKTSPGLRLLEKYSVVMGGGYNHRMGLWDGILIKDNHIESRRLETGSSKFDAIKDLIKQARKKGYRNIEIEAADLKELKTALEAGADIIMLDNMKLDDIKKAVKLRNPGTLLEVSGGVNLENVRSIAKTGVDRISIGSLTHSAPSIDFSLEVCLT